jgi:hypothetical protein
MSIYYLNTLQVIRGYFYPACPQGKCDITPGTVLADDNFTVLTEDWNTKDDIPSSDNIDVAGRTTSADSIDNYWCHGENYRDGGAFYITQDRNNGGSTTTFYAKSPWNNTDEIPYSSLHLQNKYMDSFADRCDYTPKNGYTIPHISDGAGSGHTLPPPPPDNTTQDKCTYPPPPQVNTVTINKFY